MALAGRFGGGPAYWLDPDLDPRIIDTALALLDREREAIHGNRR